MSDELKPCPHCGNLSVSAVWMGGVRGSRCAVTCSACHAVGPLCTTHDGAAIAWSTRHATDRGLILDEIYTEAAKVIDLNDLRATFLADMEKRGPGTRFGLDRAVWAVAAQAFLIGLAHAEKRKPLGGDDVNNWSLEN